MKLFQLILCLCFFLQVRSQDWNINRKYSNLDWEVEGSSILNKNRKNVLLISEIGAYTISLAGLNELWYKKYPRSDFHFINDNREWLQMDKAGHLLTSYYSGVIGIEVYKWAGFNTKKSIWYGGVTGSIFLTIIEVLDGTSEEWGASFGDLFANTAGSALAITQAMLWDEQKIKLKYSYLPTSWARKNPGQLGDTHLERALKDYNGQTYWLSYNLGSILDVDNKNFPKWLGVSFGYSAEAMIQPYTHKGDGSFRQYFLSFDVDLSQIKTKSRLVNSIFDTFGFLKFPAPAIELSNGRFLFHSVYY